MLSSLVFLFCNSLFLFLHRSHGLSLSIACYFLLRRSFLLTFSRWKSVRRPTTTRTDDEFSVNDEGRIHFGRGRARLLRPLSDAKGLDLDVDTDTVQEKDQRDLSLLLSWAQSKTGPRTMHAKEVFYDADFVCWRGLLARIGATPYNRKKAWRFVALSAGKVIYMEEKDTKPAGRANTRNLQSDQDEEIRRRREHAFKRQMTMEPPDVEPSSCRERFIVAAKSKLPCTSDDDHLQVACFAEVDGVNEDDLFVELRTQEPTPFGRNPCKVNPRDLLKLGRNFWTDDCMDVWLRDYLAGVKGLVTGLRANDGNIIEALATPIDDLETQSDAVLGRNGWQKTVCLNFIAAVLERLRSHLSGDRDRAAVWYDPKDERVHFGTSEDDVTLLSPEFIEHFQVYVFRGWL